MADCSGVTHPGLKPNIRITVPDHMRRQNREFRRCAATTAGRASLQVFLLTNRALLQ